MGLSNFIAETVLKFRTTIHHLRREFFKDVDVIRITILFP